MKRHFGSPTFSGPEIVRQVGRLWIAGLMFWALSDRLLAQGAEPLTELQFFELYERGAGHAEADDPERALKDWLSAFDRSRGVPGLEEARFTLPLEGIAALAEYHPPAHSALVQRRDTVERVLVESAVQIEDIEEVLALNSLLAGPERNLEVYDRYRSRRDADPEMLSVFRDLLWYDLLDAGRHEELAAEAELRARDLIGMLEFALEAQEEGAGGEEEPNPGESAESFAGHAGEVWHEGGEDLDLVSEALGLYEVLLHAGRKDLAEELSEAVLRLEPDAETALQEIRAVVPSR